MQADSAARSYYRPVAAQSWRRRWSSDVGSALRRSGGSYRPSAALTAQNRLGMALLLQSAASRPPFKAFATCFAQSSVAAAAQDLRDGYRGRAIAMLGSLASRTSVDASDHLAEICQAAVSDLKAWPASDSIHTLGWLACSRLLGAQSAYRSSVRSLFYRLASVDAEDPALAARLFGSIVDALAHTSQLDVVTDHALSSALESLGPVRSVLDAVVAIASSRSIHLCVIRTIAADSQISWCYPLAAPGRRRPSSAQSPRCPHSHRRSRSR